MPYMEKTGAGEPEFSKLLIIGAGLSGISSAAYYKRKYGDNDFVIYERQKELGGTWWMNNYPGCGVDIPSMLYSFSFRHKHDWTRFFASQPEILEYINDTAVKLGIKERIRFSTDVEACEWIEEKKRWRVHLRRRRTDQPWALDAPAAEEDSQLQEGDRWVHECQVIISCVGTLVQPNKCEIPGAETFKGDLFHSARWDHRVDLTGKDVVVVGNGCSAAQIVPVITPITKSTTQFIRSAQWIVPRPPPPGFGSDEALAKWGKVVFGWVPGLYTLLRLTVFLVNETVFLTFRTSKAGNKERECSEKAILEYMKSQCPEKYYDLVLPKFPLGCKRRVVDDNYLSNLYRPNMHITNDPITQITDDGVVTASGQKYHADTIVMCHGFKAGMNVIPFKLTGRNGETLEEHWKALGGPGAYKTCALNGFPNFFITAGPNSLTGYTSVLVASETVTDLAIRLIEPVIRGQADDIEVTREAELEYRNFIDTGLKGTVWSNSHCTSWYVDKAGKNIATYPFSQLHMVLDCMFPRKKDWVINYKPESLRRSRLMKFTFLAVVGGLALHGLRAPEGYFNEVVKKALWSFGHAPSLLNRAARLFDTSFLRGVADILV